MSQLSQEISNRNNPAGPGGPDTVFALIQRMAPEFEKVLSVPVDHFLRLALNELRANPQLAACTTQSLMGALMLAARLNLEPGGPLGQFYLTPRNLQIPGAPQGQKALQVLPIIGYQGLRDLAYRSGLVESIQSGLVREGDVFEYGANEERGYWFDWKPNREPAWNDEGEEVERPWTGVLAVARIRGRGTVYRYLTEKQVIARGKRGSAFAASSSPWKTDREAMALKTGIRALAPDLPKSSALATAFRADEEIQMFKVGDRVEPVQQIASRADLPEPRTQTEPEHQQQTPPAEPEQRPRGKGRKAERYAPPPPDSPRMDQDSIPVEDPPEEYR